jgi:hypothetical protein
LAEVNSVGVAKHEKASVAGSVSEAERVCLAVWQAQAHINAKITVLAADSLR